MAHFIGRQAELQRLRELSAKKNSVFYHRQRAPACW